MADSKLRLFMARNMPLIESAYDNLKTSLNTLKKSANAEGFSEEAVLAEVKKQLNGILRSETIDDIWNKKPMPAKDAPSDVWEVYLKTVNIEELTNEELNISKEKAEMLTIGHQSRNKAILEELRRRNRFYELK